MHTAGTLGHLAQVHLAGSLDVHNGRSVDGEGEGKTDGGGYGEAAVQELNDASRKHGQ